jgi:hypothetical protein
MQHPIATSIASINVFEIKYDIKNRSGKAARSGWWRAEKRDGC